jgi:ATP-binding cassette subfamily G (WHITE) protein 2 (SNQ2)
MTLVMKAWFRALAAAFKSPAPAQTVAGISVLILGLYTGMPLSLLSTSTILLPMFRTYH